MAKVTIRNANAIHKHIGEYEQSRGFKRTVKADDIYTALSVLMVYTDNKCEWTRHKAKDGALYSGVCWDGGDDRNGCVSETQKEING